MRRRLAPLLGGDLRRIELAYSLLFALPGTPVLVYGDEIGMGEDLSLEGRRAVRTPMQWSKEKNGGYSTASPKRLVLPVIDEGEYGYENVNVEAQQQEEDSLWHFVRQLIYLRRECPEIGTGLWHIMDVGLDQVLALRCTWKAGIVLTLHNFSSKRQTVDLDMHDQRGRRMQDLLGGHVEQIPPDGISRAKLDPYEYRWYRVVGERALVPPE
jgi:maltose alpha-D-glucosyltransferase/alpha-amylase